MQNKVSYRRRCAFCLHVVPLGLNVLLKHSHLPPVIRLLGQPLIATVLSEGFHFPMI